MITERAGRQGGLMTPVSNDDVKAIVNLLAVNGGNISATARAAGVSRQTVRRYANRAADVIPLAGGYHDRYAARPVVVPVGGRVRRYIITAAQNNTKINQPMWRSLMSLAEHYGARVLVSRFTYNKASAGPQSRKPGTAHASDYDGLWYDPEIATYICDERVQLAPGLVFCGEMNILPTAIRPLSDLETHTGRNSAIYPHAKLAMRSVPSGKTEATKFLWTTGACTLRNYLQRKTGQRADFHHIYGALLVEVDADGRWFVRQLNADREGRIYDLDVLADGDSVTSGHRVEAINWGDLHVAERCDWVYKLAFGPGGMLDTLRPRFQFMHDILDFKARDIHVRKFHAHHSRFRDWVEGYDSVEAEVNEVAKFLAEEATRDWCQTVCVNSNHNDFLFTWLQRDDFRHDPVNAVYWLELQLATYKWYQDNPGVTFNLFRYALERAIANGPYHPWAPNTIVLAEDESFIICPYAGGGIECGMHGDDGPNGARGSAANLARLGRKANIGHTHSAEIVDGVYVAGVSGKLDQRYNVGPSSWSHSHILTYPNGKRAIVTMWDGKWRA